MDQTHAHFSTLFMGLFEFFKCISRSLDLIRYPAHPLDCIDIIKKA